MPRNNINAASLPMISPRHVSAATRGCLVWEDPEEEKQKAKAHHHHNHHHKKSSEGNNHQSPDSTAEGGGEKKHHHRHHHHQKDETKRFLEKEIKAMQLQQELDEQHHHTSGRARVGPPPTLSVLHRAGGHEHDSNEGIKQSIMVERQSGGRLYAFPAWGGAGGGYYSCFNYKGGKNARGRYDGAFDIIPTKDTQGRRRVNDHDTLAIGATASSFVPVEKPQGLRAVRPPQRNVPMDGGDARGLHQDIGWLNVERAPSRKRVVNNYQWQSNTFNVMTEAQAPTDTRTNFQIIADAKRERNRQAKRDFLAHLKSEGQYKAVNRVPIRSTLTQRRWDTTDLSSDQQMNGYGGGDEYQQQQQQVSPRGVGTTTTVTSSSSAGVVVPQPPQNGKASVFASLSPRARKYLMGSRTDLSGGAIAFGNEQQQVSDTLRKIAEKYGA